MRRYTDRLHRVAGRGTGPRPVMAGHRERRRPAEAPPLGQLRVWTTLFGPFTGGTWERQAPPRGNPSGATTPAGRGGRGPFTPLRCPGSCEGSQAVTNPRRDLVITRSLAAGRGLNSWGWSRLTPVRRDSAANQAERRRWGSASLRLGLGADPLVFRSPGPSSGAEGVGLVPVEAGASREPHRPPIRWGGSAGLTRFGNRVCAGGQGGASLGAVFSVRQCDTEGLRAPRQRNCE